MTSWLYECLCEAELAQYYPHFTALGLQKIDELANVTMKDYSKLGVHDMNDRKRLFQLIKIIKIMQEEDKAVSSPDSRLQTSNLCVKPQKSRCGPRRQLHFDSPADNKDRTTSNNQFELCDLSDFSASEQKSNYIKVLEHMLPDDSQYHIQTGILNAAAADSNIQKAAKISPFSSNHFSPVQGDCDSSVIQRVSHVSGYNYGIPHSYISRSQSFRTLRNSLTNLKLPVSESSLSEEHSLWIPQIRQNTSEKENPWTEMEKIRVCVRKRPLGMREVRRGEINIITVKDKETLLVHEKKEAVDLTQYILQHVFYFDEIFDEACTNQDIYMKTTHPLIQHIFNGGNATCFSYGQTGAGKTYTMIGTHQNPGLYALAARDIFRQLEVSQPRRHLFVWISFYEIYCGQLYDLLNRRKRLFAREDSKHVVQIVGLRELQVDSVELLLEVLKDSFIGNAKTCMIANISPSHVATEHTLNTLRYADRVKELKKGIKGCTPANSRNRTSGNSSNASPKRIQSSPVALPGDKYSPKKVKLGLQQPLTVPSGSMRGKAHPLASHPANIPFASVPKVPGREGGSQGSPPREWVIQTSSSKGTMLSGHVAIKRAEESAALCSEKNPIGNKTPLGWGSRVPGPGGDLVRGKPPSRCKRVQTVQPVQKQLVSRGELSFGSAQRLVEYGQGSKVGALSWPASEAWTNNIPVQQEAREEHLRFYHQQFQQPPLLQQKLQYQPLERFLCQSRPPEGQLQSDILPPFHPHRAESQDGAQVPQAEDPDDSDFSEDSFSHASCQRTTKQRKSPENSEGSFFLHQREQGPEEQVAERQQSLFFSPDGDEEGVTRSWVYSRDPAGHRRIALDHGHSPGQVPLDWSGEEDLDSSGPSPREDLAGKSYCAQVDSVYDWERGGGPAFDLRQEAFRSEVPGQAEGSLPSLEDDGFTCSLSHIAVPGSPDQRDTVSTPLREVSEDSPILETRTMKNSNPFQGDDSKGELGTCSEYASGLMAPLTMSLLESLDDGGAPSWEQPAQAGTAHGLVAVDTEGPAMGHTVSSGDPEAVLPTSSATEHLWLSSSPPDDKPGGSLPALSPSPIRQRPPDELPSGEADPGEACQSRGTTLFSRGHRDANAETELDGSQGFLGKPFLTLHPGGPHAGPTLTPRAGNSDVADQPRAQERKQPTGPSWPELGFSTDPITLSCYKEDIAWLKHRPIPRSLARPGSPLAASCSPETAGTLRQPALGHAQQVVIQAHQEQLDEMAELGFKEETLMSQLAPTDFEGFVIQLDEIMVLKSKCIQSLRSQLQLYLACHKPAAGPERTAVS
ncbi:kinesin-like protein KIF24 isoform X3 [Bos indicus x Bos taurus]|uniref:kinesin-like protein KIF24 isoform X3 n=1 Tax=Bos indicus x Bos taurus TaxID=30522 RepID=UPI000F7D388B|nr:kinesin-like protein KIF24 isoform X3 [Bos indicus x Bos taurus]